MIEPTDLWETAPLPLLQPSACSRWSALARAGRSSLPVGFRCGLRWIRGVCVAKQFGLCSRLLLELEGSALPAPALGTMVPPASFQGISETHEPVSDSSCTKPAGQSKSRPLLGFHSFLCPRNTAPAVHQPSSPGLGLRHARAMPFVFGHLMFGLPSRYCFDSFMITCLDSSSLL